MKRASYREAAWWIALNDEPLELDLEVVESFISVGLVADIFGVSMERVARDVVRYRKQQARAERRQQ